MTARPGLLHPARRAAHAGAVLIAVCGGGVSSALADEPSAAVAPAEPMGPQPFGANLFLGNFLRQREDGLNPEYVVMPGDRVVVNTWGSVELSGAFVVDGQGNIFLPSIGPVRLSGVTNADLTQAVRVQIERIYRKNFGVYTNLLTAAPVAVFVTGGVRRPGRYAGVPSDSVLFFLDQAGGIDPKLGSYRKIELLREGKPLATIDLYRFILDGVLPTQQLTDGDTILVTRRGPVVEVKGEVASAGFIEFEGPDMTGADALTIVPKAARATGVTIEGLRHGLPTARTLAIDEFRDTPLRDGDSIHFRDDRRTDTILIHLEGEFDGPALLSVARGTRLIDLLNHVEVDPELANLSAIHMRRPVVAQAQKRSIDDSLFRLERSALLALSRTNREAEIRAKEAELMKSFVEAARLIQPLGRVVTTRDGKQQNVLLTEGDTIVIPMKTNVVRVGGEVQMTQAVMYAPGLRARDYVRLAGGYSQRADDDHVIILHASAAVTMSDGDALIRPGDEILVPPEVDSKLTQNAIDFTQVIYQIAVSAAVIIAL